MKNKLSDLNNHLFAQLERLGDEDLTPDQIRAEAQRAEAIVAVSAQIVRAADLQLKAVQVISECGDEFKPLAPMLTGGGA